MGPGEAEKALEQLLAFAKQHVPYYRDSFARGQGDGRRLDAWGVLTKSDIRTNADALTSKDGVERGSHANSSGGSTGEPLTVFQNRPYKDWQVATERFYYERFVGVDYDACSKIVLWGSERDIFAQGIGISAKVKNWFGQTSLLNSFRMTEKDMDVFIGEINRRKPHLVHAYAGSLYQLASHGKARALKAHRPSAIVTSAETLQPFMRKSIEEYFRCKVHDFYGSREVGPMAAECDKGRMHLFNFNNYVEVLGDRNRPVNPGEEGRVIVTTLHNYSMPLIRYEIGDLAVRGEACSCGYPGPTLDKILGRVTDHFVTEDGTLVHGEYFTHLFYFKPWVREFQVLQEDRKKIKIY